RPDGASAVLEGALHVLVIPPPQPGDFDPAEPPDFTANLVLPSGLGYHIPGEIDIEYRNDSFHSIPAPLLVLTPTQTHADGTMTAGAFLTLDASRVVSGFWTSALPDGFSHSIQILASGATPGLLQAGESGTIRVYWAGWQQPYDSSYPPFDF